MFQIKIKLQIWDRNDIRVIFGVRDWIGIRNRILGLVVVQFEVELRLGFGGLEMTSPHLLGIVLRLGSGLVLGLGLPYGITFTCERGLSMNNTLWRNVTLLVLVCAITSRNVIHLRDVMPCLYHFKLHPCVI